jgi:hypothetical protein
MMAGGMGSGGYVGLCREMERWKGYNDIQVMWNIINTDSYRDEGSDNPESASTSGTIKKMKDSGEQSLSSFSCLVVEGP